MAVKDIIANTRAKRIILSTVAEGKTGTAYMFAGDANSGKNFSALQFAKALNCLNPLPDHDCCDSCDNCRTINKVLGTLDEFGFQVYPDPDLLYLNTEKTELSIDLMRESLNSVNAYGVVKLKKKIVIIQDAERMNTEASNAILKELEEPHRNVVIMLIVNHVDQIIPTIISRCKKIEIKNDAARPELEKFIRKVKGGQWDDARIKAAAEFAEGRIGDALRYDEISAVIKRCTGILRTVSGRRDDVPSLFEFVTEIDKEYKAKKEEEKKAKEAAKRQKKTVNTGEKPDNDRTKAFSARIFLLDILRILSYIYRDLLLEKLAVKSVLSRKYGLNASDLRDYSVKKITAILLLVEKSYRDVENNANVPILFTNLFFQIRKEGLSND